MRLPKEDIERFCTYSLEVVLRDLYQCFSIFSRQRYGLKELCDNVMGYMDFKQNSHLEKFGSLKDYNFSSDINNLELFFYIMTKKLVKTWIRELSWSEDCFYSFDSETMETVKKTVTATGNKADLSCRLSDVFLTFASWLTDCFRDVEDNYGVSISIVKCHNFVSYDFSSSEFCKFAVKFHGVKLDYL
ncbi:hypothetical protein CKF54_03700 [Psittacicella hinzii]|uniref:Uncharacterized protein n=1 Tax=Psittacicella hinzii TaxID=2028575 RepID=A0A3A1Y6I4_9GAMM|nr:hypothetical protein [Psittacicella hinzii]RIY32916.1 hypothetical protein CKF54_03700 [Psittacicella hinzii]